MVTKSERGVIKKYEKDGYSFVHSGAPDFIFYKPKEDKKEIRIEDIDINSVEFVEVKAGHDKLKFDQKIWKHILTGLGLKYKLVEKHRKDKRWNMRKI